MNPHDDHFLVDLPEQAPLPHLAPSSLYEPPERCQTPKPNRMVMIEPNAVAFGPSGWSKSGIPTDGKARERLQMWTYLLEYFPDAFLAEVEVAVKGNEQHNPGEKQIRWSREKSTDHLNKAFRHTWDHARGILKDVDGTYHLAKARWRLGAALQLAIEEETK